MTRIKACSDSNCILRDRSKGGQFTQGGCQHLKERGPYLNTMLRDMGRELVALRKVEAAARIGDHDGVAAALAEMDAS